MTAQELHQLCNAVILLYIKSDSKMKLVVIKNEQQTNMQTWMCAGE